MLNALETPRDSALLPIHGRALEHDPEISKLLVMFRVTPAHPAFGCSKHIGRRLTAQNDLGRLLGTMRHRRFLDGMQAEWKAIDALTRRELGVEAPLSVREMAVAASVFEERRRFMRFSFGRLGVARLFIQSAYSTPYFSAAAQDVGMEVCELQHGLITPYHLGYSFPGRPVVPYMPNRLLLLGPYWADAAQFPINTAPLVIGSHYLEQYRQAAPSKISNRAVVVSQGVIGQRLFEVAAIAAEQSPHWEFVFRPHPAEISGHLQSPTGGTRICTGKSQSFVRRGRFSVLLASATVQIGVFSTGLLKGCVLAHGRSCCHCLAENTWTRSSPAGKPLSPGARKK